MGFFLQCSIFYNFFTVNIIIIGTSGNTYGYSILFNNTSSPCLKRVTIPVPSKSPNMVLPMVSGLCPKYRDSRNGVNWLFKFFYNNGKLPHYRRGNIRSVKPIPAMEYIVHIQLLEISIISKNLAFNVSIKLSLFCF